MTLADPCEKEEREYKEAVDRLQAAEGDESNLNANHVEQGGNTPPESDIDKKRTALKLWDDARENEKEKRRLLTECKKKHSKPKRRTR